MFRILTAVSVAACLSCAWLNDEHETPWRFEWRFLSRADSLSISNGADTRFSISLVHVTGDAGWDAQDSGTVNDSGYLLWNTVTEPVGHAEDPPDFLIRCLVARASDTLFHDTLGRIECRFRDQPSAIDGWEYVNLSRMVFYVDTNAGR